MPAASFWLLHTALMAGAAVVLLVVRFTLGRILAPAYTHLAGEAATETA
jgi:hypothetical protein